MHTPTSKEVLILFPLPLSELFLIELSDYWIPVVGMGVQRSRTLNKPLVVPLRVGSGFASTMLISGDVRLRL